MSEITEIIKASMMQEVERLNHISHNLSNVNTDGFKRQAFVKSMERQAGAVSEEQITAAASRVVTDFSQGALKPTNSFMDVALNGKGFLVVETPYGERLTRKGQLKINADGFLALESGERILSASGPISMTEGEFKITAEGDIYQNDRVVSRLQIAEPNQFERMTYMGRSLFHAESGYSQSEETTVLQGFRETSNVDGLSEMTSLLTTVRQFEAGAQVLRGYNDMVGSAISELGEF